MFSGWLQRGLVPNGEELSRLLPEEESEAQVSTDGASEHATKKPHQDMPGMSHLLQLLQKLHKVFMTSSLGSHSGDCPILLLQRIILTPS